MFRTCEITTAETPRTAAPVQLTTPPEVYAFGTYCSSMLRGVEREMMTAARKNATYNVVRPNMKRIAGRLGLNDGAIMEFWDVATLGIDIMGPADWGPCGDGRSASREVASSIVYVEDRISHVASSARYL